MKKASDPRHLQRVKRMRTLFAATFSEEKQRRSRSPEVKGILEKIEEINKLIQDAAPERPLDQINKVDLAILRISVYELLCQDTPPKVVIDEAIEIAKEYSTESAPKFVNGVLATVITTLKKEL